MEKIAGTLAHKCFHGKDGVGNMGPRQICSWKSKMTPKSKTMIKNLKLHWHVVDKAIYMEICKGPDRKIAKNSEKLQKFKRHRCGGEKMTEL